MSAEQGPLFWKYFGLYYLIRFPCIQLFFTLATNGLLTLIGIIKGTKLILAIRADNCSHVAEQLEFSYLFFINSV